jgi:hypothetical protein
MGMIQILGLKIGRDNVVTFQDCAAFPQSVGIKLTFDTSLV